MGTAAVQQASTEVVGRDGAGSVTGSLARAAGSPHRAVARGDLDVAVAQPARAALERFDGVTEVDLAGVAFVDSAGLGLLVALAHRARPQRLRVVGAGRQARTVLAMLGLDRVVDVVDAA